MCWRLLEQSRTSMFSCSVRMFAPCIRCNFRRTLGATGWVVCLSCRSKGKASNNRLPTPNSQPLWLSLLSFLCFIFNMFSFNTICTWSTVHPFGKMFFLFMEVCSNKMFFLSFASYKKSIHSITGSIYWPSCCKVHGRAHNIVDAGIPEHAATGCSEAVHNSIGPRHCIFGKMIHKHHVMPICPTWLTTSTLMDHWSLRHSRLANSSAKGHNDAAFWGERFACLGRRSKQSFEGFCLQTEPMASYKGSQTCRYAVSTATGVLNTFESAPCKTEDNVHR